MINLLSLLLSSVLWVQVPQWSDDWSKCAVDIPDASCHWYITCLLYTSDAADDLTRVDLGGRRIIKKSLFISNKCF